MVEFGGDFTMESMSCSACLIKSAEVGAGTSTFLCGKNVTMSVMRSALVAGM